MKKLVHQYITTGLQRLSEHQFSKLNDNFKNSYLRTRIINYHTEYPLEDYELEYVPKLPEKHKEEYIKKIQYGELGLRLKLKGMGLNIEIPNTDFTIQIDVDEIHHYIDSNDDISRLMDKYLSGDYQDDNYYDSDSYKWVLYDSENEKTIKDYIRKKTNGEIDPMLGKGDTSDIIGEFLNEFDDDSGLDVIISSAYSDCRSDGDYTVVMNSVKGSFDYYGEVLSVNDEGVTLKANMLKLLKSDFVDYDTYDQVNNSLTDKEEQKNWSGMFRELTLMGYTERPDFYLGEGDCETDNFNQMLKDRLEELD